MINKNELLKKSENKIKKLMNKQYQTILNETKCDEKFKDIRDFQKHNEPVIICQLCFQLKSASCFSMNKDGIYNKNCKLCYDVGISRYIKKEEKRVKDNMPITYLYCEICDVALKNRKNDKPNDSLKRHYKSRTHIKNVKKIEYREKHYKGTVFNICN